MYHPVLGRFQSRDPLSANGVDLLDDNNWFGSRLTRMRGKFGDGQTVGGSEYMYARNSPLTFNDPSGLQSERYGKSTDLIKLDCPRDCRPVFDSACTFRIKSSGVFSGTPPTVKEWALTLQTTPGGVSRLELLKESVVKFFGDYCTYLLSCFSDFDRTYSRSSNITILLLNGTRCTFTQQNFPGGTNPDDQTLPAHCRGLLEFDPSVEGGGGEPSRRTGGTYRLTREVKSVVYSFDLQVHCGCLIGDLERSGNLNPRNQAILRLSGSVPGDPPEAK